MDRKKALIIVDVQKGFITQDNKWILGTIAQLLQKEQYDAYVEAVFHAEKGSLWDKQMEWIFPKEDTAPEIKTLIPHDQYVFVEKMTNSFIWFQVILGADPRSI